MSRRPSHPLVVSYLALFVALGGTAFAAASLTGKDIADGSLTGADIRNGSVHSSDVNGITGADLGPGAAWTLRSPDKRFSTAVTNDGVTLLGPGGKVSVDAAGVVVEGTGSVDIRSSGRVRVSGSQVQLGSGSQCRPLVDASHVHPTTTDNVPTGPATSGLTTSVQACS